MSVIGVFYWYTPDADGNARQGYFECDNDQHLIEQFTALPDDGVLAFKFVFSDTVAGRHTGANANGNNWYWLQDTGNGVLYGHSDDSPDEIAARYPGAILKRGQWTTPEDMQRVVCEQAEAEYWADAPLDVTLGGCGGC